MNTVKKFEYHPIISNIVENNYEYILKKQKNKGIISDNLHLLLALHLFKYSLNELYSDNSFYNEHNIRFDIIDKEIDFLCENLISTNHETYINLYQNTLPQLTPTKIIRVNGELYEIGENIHNRIYFDVVNEKIGEVIQDKLHYIGKYRADTIFHSGLFREGANVPFVYSSYSVLDRAYLLNLPYFQNLHKEVLVNTRNFGFKMSPQNAMSVLFAEGIKNINSRASNFTCMVSAINPNLMFSAASYFASGFLPIATSPLDYGYIDGIYASRRQIEESKKKCIYAKTKPYPIYWFIKSMNKKNYVLNRQLIKQYGIINITQKQYWNK